MLDAAGGVVFEQNGGPCQDRFSHAIDHIVAFGGVAPSAATVFPHGGRAQDYPSDHCPVVAMIEFELGTLPPDPRERIRELMDGVVDDLAEIEALMGEL